MPSLWWLFLAGLMDMKTGGTTQICTHCAMIVWRHAMRSPHIADTASRTALQSAAQTAARLAAAASLASSILNGAPAEAGSAMKSANATGLAATHAVAGNAEAAALAAEYAEQYVSFCQLFGMVHCCQLDHYSRGKTMATKFTITVRCAFCRASRYQHQ